jgi:hypothetical protein
MYTATSIGNGIDSQRDNLTPRKCICKYPSCGLIPFDITKPRSDYYANGHVYVEIACCKQVGLPVSSPRGKDVPNLELTTIHVKRILKESDVVFSPQLRFDIFIIDQFGQDAWADTTTAHGRLMLTVLGGLAEFERELIRTRTGAGREGRNPWSQAKANQSNSSERQSLAEKQGSS